MYIVRVLKREKKKEEKGGGGEVKNKNFLSPLWFFCSECVSAPPLPVIIGLWRRMIAFTGESWGRGKRGVREAIKLYPSLQNLGLGNRYIRFPYHP